MGIIFCAKCLGIVTSPDESRHDIILTPDNTVFKLDSLNHIVFAARQYMRIIGGAFSIVFSPVNVILSARAPNGETAEVHCMGDDIDICDSIVKLCLELDEKLSAKSH